MITKWGTIVKQADCGSVGKLKKIASLKNEQKFILVGVIFMRSPIVDKRINLNLYKTNLSNRIFLSIIHHCKWHINIAKLVMLICLVGFIALIFPVRLESAETTIGDWRFEEGAGNTKVKDCSGANRSAKISNTNSILWGREDRYGWFLQFNGDAGGVIVDDAEPFHLVSAFTFDIRFACDFSKLGASEVSLLCKGVFGAPDYAIGVTRKGQIVVRLKGVTPSWSVIDASLESNRDYAVAVRFDGRKLSVFKDGRLLKTIQCNGSITTSSLPLVFGGQKGADFTGCLYMIRIFNTALPDDKISGWSGAAKPEVQTASMPTQIAATESFRNPAATVFSNFLDMEPKDAFSTTWLPNKWFYRNIPIFMSGVVLHVRGDDVPEISYNPGLSGRYNIYVGMRGIYATTGVQIKTSAMKKWTTIEIPLHAQEHVNYDILWATDVQMDDQKIMLRAILQLYLGYISFVPVDKDSRTKVNSSFVHYDGIKNVYDNCVERIYRDSKRLPPLTEQSIKRGYLLWKMHWMDLVFPNSIPVEDQSKIQLECFAAQGEFEPVTFALHSMNELKDVSLILKNTLKNKNGNEFKGSVDIRQTRYLNKRSSAYTGAGEYMRFPMYLESLCGRSVPQDSTQQYWITIHVPETAPAGIYTGELELSVNDGKHIEHIPISLTVYPFTLSSLKKYNFGMYFMPEEKDILSLRKAFDDMKAHGMNSVAVFSNTEIQTTGTPPSLKINIGQSTLAKMIKEFQDAGLAGEYLCILNGDSIQDFCKRFLPNEKSYADAYRIIISQIIAEGEKRRWPHLIFQLYDEVPSVPSDFPSLIRELPLLKKGGGIAVSDHLWSKTNRGAEIKKNIDKCIPFIDIFTLRYSSHPAFYVDSWEDITKRVIADKKTLYTYNINNGLAIPEMATMRFSTGWFFRTVGIGCTGYYLYTYQQFAGGCYNDFDGETDWIQQYPPSKKYDSLGGPALYWEATREGIDDLKYILTLENLIEKYAGNPQAASAVSDAKKLLAEFKSSFDIKKMQKECVFLESKWDKLTVDKEQRIAEGRFKLPNGWTFEQYDKARHQIADAIVRIMQTADDHNNESVRP